MKIKKIMVLVSALVIAGTSLVACRKAGDSTKDDSHTKVDKSTENQTITFWHTYSGDAEETCMNAIKKFEDDNSGIKVEPIQMPVDGLEQQIIAAVAGGAAPDVMGLDLVSVSKFAELDALEEITEYDGFNEIKENCVDNTIDTSYYKNGYYGVPLHRSVSTPVWNMDLLKEYGVTEPITTIDELVEMAKQHNDPKNEKWIFTLEASYAWATLPWFWSLGGNLTDDDYSVASGYLNSAESVGALETLVSWYQDGIISPSVIGEQPETWGGMLDGNYTMTVMGPWFFSSADSSFETQTTIMPEGAGGSISVIGGQDIIMFKSSEKKDATWKFMKYMVSDEVQVAFSESGLLPPIKSAKDKVDTSNKPWMDAYLEQLDTAKPRTPSPKWGEMENILAKAFEQSFRGEVEAKKALDAAAAQIDELLK